MGEYQVKESAAPKQKKKHIWWRVLLAWLGGFIAFPLVLTGLTALVGTVFSTKQVVSMFGGNPDELVGEDYQNQTILQSVMAIIQGAQNGQFDTLDGVGKLTPLVQTTVESTFNDILKGILGPDTTATISWDDIKDKKFSGVDSSTGETTGSPLADEIKNQLLDQITLASLIQDAGDLKGVYNYFLYPTLKDYDNPVLDDYGNPKTDSEGNIIYNDKLDEGGHVIFDTEHPYSLNYFMNGGAESFNSVIDKVVIGDVVDPGDNQLLNAMKNWSLGSMEENINTLKISDIFEDTSSNKLLNAIKDWSINDFGSEELIESLKVGDLFDTSASDDLMKTIGEFYIGNLKGYEMTTNSEGKVVRAVDGEGHYISWEITENLYVDDVLGDSDNKFLNSFKGKSLKELMNMDINSIKLTDIFEEDVYVEFTDTSSPEYAARHDKFNKIIHAIMESARKDDYEEAHAAGFTGEYEDWLDVQDGEGNYINREFKATIADITASNMISKLKLGEILDIEEGSLLDVYAEKKISELESLDINEVKLADLIEKAVYIKGLDDAKYNRVIAAIMEHDREKGYEAAVTAGTFSGTLEDWKAEGHYDATVGVLSDDDTIQDLFLSDVVEINEGEILNSFKDKRISELSSISVDDIYLRDLFDEEVYIKGLSAEKYNKVIGAIMEKEREKGYTAAVTAGTFTGTLEDWKAEGHYDAKASAITSQESIDSLKLSDVITNPNDGSVAANLLDSLDKDGATIGNLSDKIKDIQMGKLFGVPVDGLGNYVSYDECRDDIPYVLYSLRDSTLDNLTTSLDTLTISQAMEIYEENVYKKNNNGDYVDAFDNVIDESELATKGVIIHEKSNPIILAIKDKEVSDTDGIVGALKNDIELKNIIDINGDSPLILQNLKDTKLSEIETAVEGFKLKDVMDVYKKDNEGHYLDADGNVTNDPAEYVYASPIIGAMADVKIFSEDNDGLKYKMDHLQFNEVFTYDDCEGSNVLKALWTRNGNGAFAITDIGTAMQNVTFVDLIGDDLYEGGDSSNPITYTWWYLLTERDETESWKLTVEGRERIAQRRELGNGLTYTVNSFDKIVDNMEYHMQNENLYSLSDAGFVTISQATLDMSIRTNPTNPLDTTEKLVGDMTVSELITVFERYLAFYNSLGI